MATTTKVLIAALSLGSGVAHAATWTCPKGDCALDLPDAEHWLPLGERRGEGLVFAAGRTEGRLVIELGILENPVQFSALEPMVLQGLKEQLAKTGGVWQGSREVRHQDLPAIDFDAQVQYENVPAIKSTRWVATDTRIYQVSVVHPVGQELDRSVEDYFARFRLLGAIKAAGGSPKDSPFTGLLAVGLGAAVLVAAVAGAIFLVSRRSA